jgi:translocator protein
LSRVTGAPRWIGLAGWIALCFLPAWFGQQFTAAEWYQQLNRPGWAPPTEVFGPVWTILYTAMGVAAWLVWSRTGLRDGALPLGLFVLQLVPNALWSWLFFGLNRMELALADIVVLWVLIAATMVAFWRVHRVAALLLVPYLLWVSYATALNAALWQLNR